MIEAIIMALHLLAYTGECASLDNDKPSLKYYGIVGRAQITGVVNIDGCPIPTIPALAAPQIRAIYASLKAP